jgi:hypothetical protein
MPRRPTRQPPQPFSKPPAPLRCSNPHRACARLAPATPWPGPPRLGPLHHISWVHATFEAAAPILIRVPFGCHARACLLAALAGALQAVCGQEAVGQSYRPTGPSSDMCRSSYPTRIALPSVLMGHRPYTPVLLRCMSVSVAPTGSHRPDRASGQ